MAETTLIKRYFKVWYMHREEGVLMFDFWARSDYIADVEHGVLLIRQQNGRSLVVAYKDWCKVETYSEAKEVNNG